MFVFFYRDPFGKFHMAIIKHNDLFVISASNKSASKVFCLFVVCCFFPPASTARTVVLA